TAFENREQLLAGVADGPRRERVVTAELGLEDAVEAFEFLLLAQAQTVFGLLTAAQAVHAGRRQFLVDWALRAEAALAFEIQLHLLSPAHFANGIQVPGHEE